jgi:hypothetical protein
MGIPDGDLSPRGTEMGKKCPPQAFVGIPVGKFFCRGDGFGELKPDGEFPVAIPSVGCIQSTSFCHRNHFFVFRNEHAQSTTLGPKLMFGVVSRNFVVARHPFRKRVSGAYKARVFATGTISSFFATNMPNPLL